MEGGHYYELALRREDGDTNKGAFGRAVRYLPDREYDAILRSAFATIISVDMPSDIGSEITPIGFAEFVAAFERPLVEQVVTRPFRDAAFSGAIKAAYNDTCAFTGLKIINGGSRSEVQAAHVRPVASAGPDLLRNGIALCGTFHWMFDRGLVSIADDHQLLLAKGLMPDFGLPTSEFRAGSARADSRGSGAASAIPALASGKRLQGMILGRTTSPKVPS